VRLASQLSGWDIDILTEAEESERRQKEFQDRSKMFVEALDVDDVIAHLLVTEGVSSVEEVGFVPVDDLVEIEGFDEDVAAELQERARAYLSTREEEMNTKRKELGVEDDIAALDGINAAIMVAIGEKGIKTLDDLADLAGDELLEMLPAGTMSLDDANAVIMAARAHWFADEPVSEDVEGGDETPTDAPEDAG